MSTATPERITPVKFHASLNVADLERSIKFYRVLFGMEPAKQRPDYAKFELDEPPLVLSLIPGRAGARGNLNHAGLRVRDAEELVRIQARLEAAEIPTQREDGVECCYSRQTKFWVADPDAALWEIYVLHEDVDEAEHDHPTAMADSEASTPACERQKVTWEHHISAPIPDRIPHDDNSVNEVYLHGTANLRPETACLPKLLAEAFRVLRPGGVVRLRGLSGDGPLKVELPALPGPAAAVQFVPAHADCARALAEAHFTELTFEKLSTTAYFTIGGVPMRESVIVGRKPGFRPAKLSHGAIYLGPFASITDDFGNVYRRGEATAINIHDWQLIKNSAGAVQFLLLSPAASKPT